MSDPSSEDCNFWFTKATFQSFVSLKPTKDILHNKIEVSDKDLKGTVLWIEFCNLCMEVYIKFHL